MKIIVEVISRYTRDWTTLIVSGFLDDSDTFSTTTSATLFYFNLLEDAFKRRTVDSDRTFLSSIKNPWHRFARSTYQAFTMKYSKLYHDRFRIKFSRRLPNRTYPGDGRRGTLSLRYGVFVNKLHAQSIRNIDRKLLGAYRIFDAQNGLISRWNIRRTTCLLDVFHFLSFPFLFRLLGSRGRGFQRVTNIHVL